MVLESLPDSKTIRPLFNVGQDYQIMGVIGNGLIVTRPDDERRFLLLRDRFVTKPQHGKEE